jgi:hypothetical protein
MASTAGQLEQDNDSLVRDKSSGPYARIGGMAADVVTLKPSTQVGRRRVTRYQPPRFAVVAYARNAEDVVLLRTFADRRGGFYVDIGAGEPDSGSLTKNLVDRLGWQGVNIEPLPDRLPDWCPPAPVTSTCASR